MGLSNEQLIYEAIECNHAGVGSSTLERYRDHLVHFAHYLASVHASDFYSANKKQVRLFMGHLEKQGGATPDPTRLRCDWCKARGYPVRLTGGRKPLLAEHIVRPSTEPGICSTATMQPIVVANLASGSISPAGRRLGFQLATF